MFIIHIILNRNRRVFEDVACSESQFKMCFASSLFNWSHVWGYTSSISIIHFIASLSLNPYNHGFKNRTGPAGSTGDRCLIRSGSLKKPKIWKK